MNFISVGFIFFVSVVFILYWFLSFKKLYIQNVILLVSSFVFYGLLDKKFLAILVVISIIGYSYGVLIKSYSGKFKRLIFWLSIIFTLSSLFYFKYYNFFISEFISALSVVGFDLELNPLNIILPIGISFYTFQSLGYIIDVYYERIQPERNIVEYFLFITFFPQLFAGPIGRGKELLPQYKKLRVFDYETGKDGLRMILWGFFKKIVIADEIGMTVDIIFDDYVILNGGTIVLGSILYSIQIYADFSGYNDIARGTAKLFGINLMINFKYPYFSKDINDFWRRWHISLSNWLRDYLFLPLSFIFYRKFNKIQISKKNKEYLVYSIAVLLTWFIGGIWHGASTAFVLWGLLHGISLVLWNNSKRIRLKFYKKINLKNNSRYFIFLQSLFTFFLVTFFWLFFRAGEINIAFSYISEIFSGSLFIIPRGIGIHKSIWLIIILFFFIEWLGREQQYAIAHIGTRWYKPVRWAMYYCIIITIFYFIGKDQQFIYFQF